MTRDEVDKPGIPELCARIRPRRRITGMSAILLPFDAGGAIDWRAFAAHVERTAEAGLVPAVNMDTGYGPLLEEDERERALDLAKAHAGGEFVAAAWVADGPGASFDEAGYRAALDRISARGGLPIVFPSYGLTALAGANCGPSSKASSREQCSPRRAWAAAQAAPSRAVRP